MRRQITAGIALLALGGSMLVGRDKPQQLTLADERWLLYTYRAESEECLTALAEQEALVNNWGQKIWMVHNSKVPNPYWSARTLAGVYRGQCENLSKRAAAQDRIIEQRLQSTPPRP